MKAIDYRENEVKAALHRHEMIDNWFPVRYSINPYSGCEYGCRYCRANWRPAKKILIKSNLPEILAREFQGIDSPQLIGVGGGFNDVFSPINNKKKLGDGIIKQILEAGHRPFIMTKNPSYALEIMEEWLPYDPGARPIVMTGFCTPSQDMATVSSLEPGVPSPRERLSALKALSQHFITGASLLPWLSSDREPLREFLLQGKEGGWGFALLGFLDGSPPGVPVMPLQERARLQKDFLEITQELQLWPRLPRECFSGWLSPKDEITVLLGYHYYFGDTGKKTSFRLAAYEVNRLSEKEFQKIYLADQLDKIPGVGPVISGVIRDFIRYRRSDFFTKKWENRGYQT